MRFTLLTAALAVTLPLGACTDPEVETSPLLDQLTDEISAANLDLEDAIEIAQAEAPEGTVLSAELVWTGDVTNYDVDLLLNGDRLVGSEVLELDISADTGAVLVEDRWIPEADEVTALHDAATIVELSEGWPLVIDVAEIAVAGTAIEARAVPSVQRLEVELFAPDGIWRVTSRPDGSDVRADRIPTDVWELEETGREPDGPTGVL